MKYKKFNISNERYNNVIIEKQSSKNNRILEKIVNKDKVNL